MTGMEQIEMADRRKTEIARREDNTDPRRTRIVFQCPSDRWDRPDLVVRNHDGKDRCRGGGKTLDDVLPGLHRKIRFHPRTLKAPLVGNSGRKILQPPEKLSGKIA